MSQKNIFKIPNLQPMLEAVTAFVLNHQGDKGFILTDNPDKDRIYDIEYSFDDNRADEFHVKAIRVKNGMLEIITDVSNVRYNDEAVREIPESVWDSVKHSDLIYFVPTIFNIAENIEEYVSE